MLLNIAHTRRSWVDAHREIRKMKRLQRREITTEEERRRPQRRTGHSTGLWRPDWIGQLVNLWEAHPGPCLTGLCPVHGSVQANVPAAMPRTGMTWVPYAVLLQIFFGPSWTSSLTFTLLIYLLNFHYFEIGYSDYFFLSLPEGLANIRRSEYNYKNKHLLMLLKKDMYFLTTHLPMLIGCQNQ